MTSEVAFSLKHYFLIKNSLLGAGNLAPSYHCSSIATSERSLWNQRVTETEREREPHRLHNEIVKLGDSNFAGFSRDFLQANKADITTLIIVTIIVVLVVVSHQGT